MLAGIALLAILDASIVSVTPDPTRIAIAFIVTLAVGGFILAVWRSNSKLEKAVDVRNGTGGSRKSTTGGDSSE